MWFFIHAGIKVILIILKCGCDTITVKAYVWQISSNNNPSNVDPQHICGRKLVITVPADVLAITVTSQWAQWRLKSPASRFNYLFMRRSNETSKLRGVTGLCGGNSPVKFTGDRWIPHTKGQWRGKCFHLMTSSCSTDGACHKQAHPSRFFKVSLVIEEVQYMYGFAVQAIYSRSSTRSLQNRISKNVKCHKLLAQWAPRHLRWTNPLGFECYSKQLFMFINTS